MIDSLGRNIDYMRISVTDKCNLRCKYCMPDDIKLLPMQEILTYEEITECCSIAAGLGIRKIKLTGGEPLVRRQFVKLVGMIKAVPGIEQVTMTTNGVLLAEQIEPLKEAGLDAVNVSLDTLDPAEFAAITGRNEMDKVLTGIDAAIASGIPVKINTVYRPELKDQTILDLFEYVKNRPIDLRFIEIMPIGAGRQQKSCSNTHILEVLTSACGSPEEDHRVHGNGPAVYYHFSGMQGSIGLISAMHGKFCSSCNRIRMSATGKIKPCLCYEAMVDIRTPLREGNLEEVRKRFGQAIYGKPKAHCFETPDQMTETGRMVSIGG